MDCWTLSLNTAIASGSPFLNLAARIHATCEIHGYVEGPNRAWLAGLIEEGRKRNIFRPEMGWEEVVDFLRLSDDTPVVMSYSVTESFPNPWEMGWFANQGFTQEQIDNDEGYEGWEKLSYEEQWDLAMEWLRNNGDHVEMAPDQMERRFGRSEPFWSLYDMERWLDDQAREKAENS